VSDLSVRQIFHTSKTCRLIPYSWTTAKYADITQAMKYRKEWLPLSEDRSNALATVAAGIIIQGLSAYGWTSRELSESKSTLIQLVGGCVDLKVLVQGIIRPVDDCKSDSKSPPVNTPAKPTRKRKRASSASSFFEVGCACQRKDGPAQNNTRGPHMFTKDLNS
jgi:hypothetical protein